MATLTYKSGRAVIQFELNRRRTLSVTGVNAKTANTIRGHVDELVNHNINRQPLPQATAGWLADIGDPLYQKLVGVRLVKPRSAHISTELAAYLDKYIAGRTDLKPRTITNLKQARNSLVTFFGAKRDLTTINRGEMADWRRAMLTKLSAATIATHVKKARQMFADAVDRGLVTDNPAKSIKAGSMANEQRQHYVTVADILKVIDKCPDAEWRLIFALARFGGLRTPSETHLLRWTDIHWDTNRITIRSPKTEHHENKATREIPLFPELIPYLYETLAQAQDGTRHVIVRQRGENLRTQAERIIEKSGVAQWPKLFQNLRSSRQTDLENDFPSHVVCAWMGNSEKVARKHYLQVTDDHFSRAVRRAVDRSGKVRTDTGHGNEKPPKNGGSSQTSLPPRGAEHRRKALANARKSERALRQALRCSKRELNLTSKRDIRRLAGRVDSAHRRAGGAR